MLLSKSTIILEGLLERFDEAKAFLESPDNQAGVIFPGEPGIVKVPSPKIPHPRFSEAEGDLALVFVLYVGWCLSDEEKRRSGSVKPPPKSQKFLRLGHEWVGLIAQDTDDYPIGTPVIGAVRLKCYPYKHPECIVGETCTNKDEYLSIGSTRCHGALAPVVLLPKEALVALPVEDLHSIPYAFYVESLSVTRKPIALAQEAIENRSKKRGNQSKIGIVGVGGIGLPALFWLTRWKDAEVYAFDIHPKGSTIDKLAQHLGVNYVSVANKVDVDTLIGSFDYIVETSGAPKAFVTSLQLLGQNGMMSYLSLPGDGQAVITGEILKASTLKEIKIEFSVGFGMSHLKDAAKAFPAFYQEIGTDFFRQTTHEIPFSSLSNESINTAREQHRASKIYIKMQE